MVDDEINDEVAAAARRALRRIAPQELTEQ
jgi:hypothetical protein